jgi:putative ABC transport system permease protein
LENRLYQLPNVQVVSFSQVKQTIMTLVSTTRVLVFSIAVIALLIAMFGVANTVLMSVVERLKEIGVLKTMGAMPSDIFLLVWTETLILCIGGGIAGIGLAIAFARVTDVLVRRVLPYTPKGGLVEIELPLALLTLVVVGVVGLVSGAYPAWRAGMVRPLETIRRAG